MPFLGGLKLVILRRSAWRAYAIVSLTVAIPILGFYGGLAFDNALETQATVQFNRDIASSTETSRVLRSSSTRVLDDGTTVRVVLLSSEGELKWPGLEVAPTAEQVYMSTPILNRRDEVMSAVPELGSSRPIVLPLPESLSAEPNEAVLLAAVNASMLPDSTARAGQWSESQTLDVEGRILIPLLISLAIPALALLRSCSTYLITVNQHQLSALRLFGVTSRAVKVGSALLIFALCLPSIVLGGAFFKIVPWLSPSLTFGTQSVFTRNLKLSLLEGVGVGAITAVTVISASLLATRDVSLDPLSVRQKSATLKPFQPVRLLLFPAALVSAFFYQSVVSAVGDQVGVVVLASFLLLQAFAATNLARFLIHLAAATSRRFRAIGLLFSGQLGMLSPGLSGLLVALSLTAFFTGFALPIAASIQRESSAVDIRFLSAGGVLPPVASVEQIQGVDSAEYIDGVLEVRYLEGAKDRAEIQAQISELVDGNSFVEQSAVLATEQDIANQRIRATISGGVSALTLLLVSAFLVYVFGMLERNRSRFELLKAFGTGVRELLSLGYLMLLVPLACFAVAPLLSGLLIGALVRDSARSSVPLVDPTAQTGVAIFGTVIAISLALVLLMQVSIRAQVPASFE